MCIRDRDTLWPELRERFDFIVVDSPPAIPTNEGIALAARADVVALVIEAERTRAALAREAQTRLSDAKANLVGVILNRRRHHIPRWLYRLLKAAGRRTPAVVASCWAPPRSSILVCSWR